jgi:hypothetical protein
MGQTILQRRLVRRQSTTPCFCIKCNKIIPANELHYVEEGVNSHLPALIARRFCGRCYSMHGEQLIK